MTHEEFLDELCRRRQLNIGSYLRSALADREDEAVARWMVGVLFSHMAHKNLAFSREKDPYARVNRVFQYWERDQRERVIFASSYAGPEYLDVRVGPAGPGSYLMELHDFPRNRPMHQGAVVGELRDTENRRIQIETILGIHSG